METTAEAAAILFSMRSPSAAPPGSVPAQLDIDLNKAAGDDEGGGGDADHSRRRGGELGAEGSAPAALGDAATPPPPERVRTFPLCFFFACQRHQFCKLLLLIAIDLVVL